MNRVKNKRVLPGVPLTLLSLLLDHTEHCWARSDERVVTDVGLAGTHSLLLQNPATKTELVGWAVCICTSTTAIQSSASLLKSLMKADLG